MTLAQHQGDPVRDRSAGFGSQYSNLSSYDGVIGRKELSRAGMTGTLEATALEMLGIEPNGRRISIRFTGNLTEQEITAAHVAQDDCRANFRTGDVREGKPDNYDGSNCRCCHATSSSGRSHSVERADSLNLLASIDSERSGASSRKVTNTRCARESFVFAGRRSRPSVPSMALTVFMMSFDTCWALCGSLG
jgi:hypothetical protein